MKLNPISSSLFVGTTMALVAAQPALAADFQIVEVELQRGNGEFELILTTVGDDDRPQVLTSSQGRRLVAEIPNAQLQVNGNTTGFKTNNPLEGIESVELVQSGPETVRIEVIGTEETPLGQIRTRLPGQIVLGFTSAANARTAVQNPDAMPPLPAPAAAPDEEVTIGVQPAPNLPPSTAATAPTAEPDPSLFQLDPSAFQVSQSTPRSDVLVPDPEITINGSPALPSAPAQPNAPAPLFLPRAVAPPVGDIAVANVAIAPQLIDLGSDLPVFMRVDEANVTTVLQSLANMADINLVVAGAGGDPAAAAAGAGAGVGGTISMELQGETVQDAFNYVLQLSGLQAVRKGRTVLVGTQLPQSVRELVSRTFRLNQVGANDAASALITLGAELQLRTIETEVTDIGVEIGEDNEAGTVTRQIVTETPTITRLTPEDSPSGALPLRGLTLSTDERLNTITMVGEPFLIETAANYLQQLDARKRQVAVNVKIIDVNLENIGRFGTSFSFGINDTGFINQGGIGIINFGGGNEVVPAITGLTPSTAASGTGTGAATVVSNQPGFNLNIQEFVAQLQLSLQNNNAKILTDPTIIIQEGESALVSLVEEVVSEVDTTIETTDAGVLTTTNITKEDVGLRLEVNVTRIDDNGFVSLQVSPEVSSVGSLASDFNGIALINTRTLSSGLIRMRDGQTLVLSGIIQDQDTVAVSKIPILGDLPIIGSLFRRTSRTNARTEVIVLVTPNVIDDAQPFGYSYYQGQPAPNLPQRN